MFLASTSTVNIGLLDSAVVAVLGYAVVFFGLILLMLATLLLGKLLSGTSKKKPQQQAAPAAPAAPAPVAAQQPAADDVAPGSAGKLKLHDVPPKTAAMLMAIVADKMGKPLNELRFISIKEEK
jgi:Na+-transporting methylmalonyl-CoA/oxaloacetate decarboxylase gamma subunit